MFSKLTTIRELAISATVTLFLCITPQQSPFWIGAVFIGLFTILETYPEVHWMPSWTAYKLVAKEEELAQGALRIAAQFIGALLGGIIGYQLLDVSEAVRYPMETLVDNWRTFLWLALLWAATLALLNHSNKKDKGTLRRNLAITATYCSANYMLQGIAADYIINTAVNFGRLIGAKIYFDAHEDAIVSVDLKNLWIVLLAPAAGVILAWASNWGDAWLAAWDAPNTGNNEETTAVYGSTDNQQATGDTSAANAGSIALADKKEDAADNA